MQIKVEQSIMPNRGVLCSWASGTHEHATVLHNLIWETIIYAASLFIAPCFTETLLNNQQLEVPGQSKQIKKSIISLHASHNHDNNKCCIEYCRKLAFILMISLFNCSQICLTNK